MLRQVLEEREEAIVERWLDCVLEAYSARGGAVFKRRSDQFANPVGHAAREGTRTLFRSLLEAEPDRAQVEQSLADILRQRAVQQMPPSTAVGFVLELKALVRAELKASEGAADLAPALRELEGRIDRLALTAFDIYVAFREELAQLKVKEARRHVSWIADRLNGKATAEDTRVRGGSLQ